MLQYCISSTSCNTGHGDVNLNWRLRLKNKLKTLIHDVWRLLSSLDRPRLLLFPSSTIKLFLLGKSFFPAALAAHFLFILQQDGASAADDQMAHLWPRSLFPQYTGIHYAKLPPTCPLPSTVWKVSWFFSKGSQPIGSFCDWFHGLSSRLTRGLFHAPGIKEDWRFL